MEELKSCILQFAPLERLVGEAVVKRMEGEAVVKMEEMVGQREVMGTKEKKVQLQPRTS